MDPRFLRAGLWLCLALGLTAGCGGKASSPAEVGVVDAVPGDVADGGGPRDGGGDGSRDLAADGASDTAEAATADALHDGAVDAAGELQPQDGPPADAISTDAPGPALTIYLSPTGVDGHDGLTQAQSILTLGRAQEIIAAAQPAGDVEVRIAPGDYYGQQVVWTYTMADHVIRFMPLAGDKVRPVFDGCLTASPAGPADCPGGTWFRLSHSQGQATNLHFEYIRVQRYQTAISLNGNRNSAGASNGENRIYGCYFYNIGTQYNTTLNPSTAALRLVNSDDNEIANNHFINIINHSSCGLLHAIYAAHMSDRNLIRGNRFKNGCGDPLRFRDYSNDNVIRENKLIKIGVYAGYTDWYCDHDVNPACTKPGPECPSWENQFRDNLLDGDYDCDPLGVFKYFQDDSTTGCSPPFAGAKRLYTSGNTKTPVPCTN